MYCGHSHPLAFLICTPYIDVKSDANIAVDSAALMLASKSRKSVMANCQAQILRMNSEQPDIDFVPVVKLFTPDAQCIWLLTDRGRERRSPSPPSEPGVQFSRDGLSSQLFPHRDWRANRWASDIVKSPRSAK